MTDQKLIVRSKYEKYEMRLLFPESCSLISEIVHVHFRYYEH